MFTCGIHVACWFETSRSIEFDLFLNNTGPATQCSNLHCRVCCCHRTTVFGIDITSCGILCKYHINYKFSCLLLIFNTTFPSFTVASLPGSEVYTACWTVVGCRISHSVWLLTVWQKLLMAKQSSVEHLQTFCDKIFRSSTLWRPCPLPYTRQRDGRITIYKANRTAICGMGCCSVGKNCPCNR